MLRKGIAAARRFASLTQQVIRLESQLVIVEAQRDLVGEQLGKALNALEASEGHRVAERLRRMLTRHGLTPDGEPTLEELLEAISAMLREGTGHEADVQAAIDRAAQVGLDATVSGTPAYWAVDALALEIEGIREDAEKRMNDDDVKALVDWRLEAIRLASEVAASPGASGIQRRNIGALLAHCEVTS